MQDVVPDDLDAALRDREGNPGRRTLDAVAVGDQLGTDGIETSGIVDPLRYRSAAAGREYAQVVVRIALQQRLHAFGKLVFMFLQIVAIDPVQQRISGERVGMMHARLVAGRCLDATGPSRNGAGGIARPLRPQRRQVLPQPRGLGAVHLGLCLHSGTGRQQQNSNLSVHRLLPQLCATQGMAMPG